MSDEMVLVPKSLLSCPTADGLYVRDVMDNHMGSTHLNYYVPITAASHRNQVIRELIENVPEGLWGFSPSEQEAVSEWLKSQMEGE